MSRCPDGVSIGFIGAVVMVGDGPQPRVETVSQIQYIPIVVTAVPEPDIPNDLWRCIQNPSLSVNAPDIGLDYQNYDVVDLRIKAVGDKGQLNVYAVYNWARNEVRTVTVEWGIDAEGFSTLVRCEVPIEWSNYRQPPTATPYLLPGERLGTPQS